VAFSRLRWNIGKKQKQTTTQNHTYMTPPPTAATTNLQSMVDSPVDYATPIRSTYSRARKESDRSYDNPLGAFTTADVKDKSKRAANFNLSQSESMDLANAAQQSGADKFNRQATVAGLTNPQLVNSGSSSVTSTPFNWGGLITGGIGAGASLGQAAIL
jgi:hypothetical protein